MKDNAVFIKIDEYKEVMDIMVVIKKKVKEAKAVMATIIDIKAREDAELEDWQAKISDMEKKTELVDKILFAPANE